MPVIYIGRPTPFVGKTLFEILCNLKNLGVGRMLIRNIEQKHSEPSFYVIRKAEPLMDEKLMFGKCWAEVVFRGIVRGDFVDISNQSYMTDFELVPKADEPKYRQGVIHDFKTRILPRDMAFPPVLHEILLRERRARGDNVSEIRLPLIYSNEKSSNIYRAAQEGEEPTEYFEQKPKLSPQFLVGITEI